MDWKVILNVVLSGLASALAAYGTTKATSASDETAYAAAGTTFLTAVIQHFRAVPSGT